MNPLDQAFLNYRTMKSAPPAAEQPDPSAPREPSPPEEPEAPSPILRCGDQLRWPPVIHEILSSATGRFRQLGGLLLESARCGTRCVAVTSCHRGEGRTTLALALARWLADQYRERKLLLVDADWGRPTLTGLLGQSSDCETDESGGDSAGASSDNAAGGLAVLGLSSLHAEGSTVEVQQWAAALQCLRPHFELILFDTGPALADSADRDDIPKWVEAALWVRDPVRTTRDEFDAALRQLGIPSLGVIENFVARETVESASHKPTFRLDVPQGIAMHHPLPFEQPKTGARTDV